MSSASKHSPTTRISFQPHGKLISNKYTHLTGHMQSGTTICTGKCSFAILITCCFCFYLKDSCLLLIHCSGLLSCLWWQFPVTFFNYLERTALQISAFLGTTAAIYWQGAWPLVAYWCSPSLSAVAVFPDTVYNLPLFIAPLFSSSSFAYGHPLSNSTVTISTSKKLYKTTATINITTTSSTTTTIMLPSVSTHS